MAWRTGRVGRKGRRDHRKNNLAVQSEICSQILSNSAKMMLIIAQAFWSSEERNGGEHEIQQQRWDIDRS